MKYVLVSGGVISGIGKGVLASSTGLLLKTIGLKVSAIKIDPYLNIDAGTMSPLEHGECFVLNDGGEVDLDLGNYERFLNITLTRENNITTGKIYQSVLDRERKGDYLGKTVQIVPHLTDAIQDWIQRVSRIPVDETNEEPDICIIELGGTIGDIESYPFMEAMRSLRLRAGKNNFAQIHVSLVPVVNGELKTKPTQHAVRDVRSGGLSPDLIACRCDQSLDDATIEKLAHFCQVELGQVLAVPTLPSTYHVPHMLKTQGIIESLSNVLKLDMLSVPAPLLQGGQDIWKQWQQLTTAQDRLSDEVTIVIVGKYANWTEAYLSVIKALEHASMHCFRKLKKVFVNAEHLENDMRDKDPANFFKAWHSVSTASGIIVPGGFGERGTEGLIATARWARENKRPYLGVCLGMQLAVIEFARNACKITDATSGEFASASKDAVIINMPELDSTKMGGTMRLGMRPTHFQEGSQWSRLRKLYGVRTEHIMERHRHRYEVNPEYIHQFEQAGIDFIGRDDSGKRMEIVELRDHPWFVGVQFHPEYLSKVLEPSVPYLGFIAASSGQLEEITQQWQTKASPPIEATLVNGVKANGHV